MNNFQHMFKRFATKPRAKAYLFLCFLLPISLNCHEDVSVDDSLANADAYDDVVKFEFGGKQNAHEGPLTAHYFHRNPGEAFVVDITRESGQYWQGLLRVNTPRCEEGELSCGSPKYNSSNLDVQLFYVDTSSYEHPSDALILEGCHPYGHCDLSKFGYDPDNAIHIASEEIPYRVDTANGPNDLTYRSAEYGIELLSSSYDIARLVIFSSTPYIEVTLSENDDASDSSTTSPL